MGENKEWFYCDKCNKIYTPEQTYFAKLRREYDCPYCEDGTLTYLGELTKLQLRAFQYDVKNEDFDIEKWRKE